MPGSSREFGILLSISWFSDEFPSFISIVEFCMSLLDMLVFGLCLMFFFCGMVFFLESVSLLLDGFRGLLTPYLQDFQIHFL